MLKMGDDESNHRSDTTSGCCTSDSASAGAQECLNTGAAESDEFLVHVRDGKGDPATFHSFGRLPPELRRHVWALFCPEMLLKSRLLDITVGPPSERHAHGYSWPQDVRPWTAHDGRTLKAMTLTTRRLLSVNRESRAIALESFPDSLSLDLAPHDAIVRFNKETDVILLTGYGMDYHDTEKYHFPEFATQIKQLAVSATLGYKSTARNSVGLKSAFLRQFPVLERIFFLLENMQYDNARDLRWCVPGYVHELHVGAFKNMHGPGDDLQMVFCWPNVDEHKTFHDMHRTLCRSLPSDMDELLELGIEPYPMAIFQFKSGLAWYKDLQAVLASSSPDFMLDIDTGSEEESVDISGPDGTEPDDTEPGGTEPDDREPDDTEPDDTEPDDTEPDDTEAKVS